MTMNKTVDDNKDDINEESSCSESHQIAPASSLERDVAQEDKEMTDRIIKKEEKAVRTAKFVVIAAIIVCAMAAITTIYVFATKSDQDTFELEVSNNHHINCCSIVIATDGALTLVPTSYSIFHDTPFSLKTTSRILPH
jgi:hypothetical protein